MDFTNNEDDSDSDDDVLNKDGDKTHVIRKSLLTLKDHCDKDWRCNNIFHSICTIEDKVCSLIIDSRSHKNMVYAEVVRKFQLATENHLKPYKLTWLNKDTEVIVDRHCLVSFSIGQKYFDNT
jgi:hypothetical protein